MNQAMGTGQSESQDEVGKWSHVQANRKDFFLGHQEGRLRLIKWPKNCISSMLPKHIKTVGIPLRKISSFQWPIKDDLALKTSGVYSICKREKVCTGQTGHSIETRVNEHHRHIQLYHLEKLAMAKHSINIGH
jgi:hypothetical protein